MESYSLQSLFQVQHVGPVGVIELALPGALDVTEFDRLTEALGQTITASAGARWVLDLERVEYFGSAMLGLLVNVRHVVNHARGRLALCALPPRLHRGIEATSLQRLFTIARTRSDAVKLLNHH